MLSLSEIKKIAVKNPKMVKKVEKFLMHRSTSRLDIMLELVGLGKATFKELQEKTGLKPSTLSYHLKTLIKRGYITKKKIKPEKGKKQKTEYFPARKGIAALACLIDVPAWVDFYRNPQRYEENAKFYNEVYRLQKLYEETGDEKYREKAFKLLEKFYEKHKHELLPK